jgi:hypothetical protein
MGCEDCPWARIFDDMSVSAVAQSPFWAAVTNSWNAASGEPAGYDARLGPPSQMTAAVDATVKTIENAAIASIGISQTRLDVAVSFPLITAPPPSRAGPQHVPGPA